MKIQPVKQTHESGCGPACIKMVSDYFGKDISISGIEELSGDWKEDGMGNQDIVKVLEELGFKVSIKKESTWEDLIQQNKEGKVVLVSWMMRGYVGHFSVVNKVTENSISLADPETGVVIEMEKLVFLRLWFDYDDHWYPERVEDITLRWMAVVEE